MYVTSSFTDADPTQPYLENVPRNKSQHEEGTFDGLLNVRKRRIIWHI